MTGCADGSKQAFPKLDLLSLGFWGAWRRRHPADCAMSHPIPDDQTFLIRDRQRFRTVRNGHRFLVISPLPTVPQPSFDFPAVCKGGPVIQPVVNKPRLIVMASGALAHDDGQYVPEVSWRLIGHVRPSTGALRQSPSARQAGNRSQETRSH